VDRDDQRSEVMAARTLVGYRQSSLIADCHESKLLLINVKIRGTEAPDRLASQRLFDALVR
jgi:hypothetical protein